MLDPNLAYTAPGALYRSYRPRWFQPAADLAFRAALRLGVRREWLERAYMRAAYKRSEWRAI